MGAEVGARAVLGAGPEQKHGQEYGNDLEHKQDQEEEYGQKHVQGHGQEY